jgi:predicted transcriptional regulator
MRCNPRARWHRRRVKKDAQITVRIGSDLREKLEALAKAEDRSIAYVVERILRAHFEGDTKPKARKPG